MIAEKEGGEIKDESESHPHGFDYLEHYKTDAEQFDYFEERTGAAEHSERRVREYILSQIPQSATSILDVGSGSAWVARKFQGSNVFVCSLDATIVNTSRALEKYPSPKHAAVVADAFALPFRKALLIASLPQRSSSMFPSSEVFVLLFKNHPPQPEPPFFDAL